MKSHITAIGVIDKENRIHSVEFSSGVNVITGKSSTGKSAMIEIFDYCFGSSEFTVPSGIITDHADIYFVVMAIQDTNIVIARAPSKSTKGFIKEETTAPIVNNFSKEYFDNNFFIQLSDFRQELGRYFGLDIEDTDVDLEDKKYRKNHAKKGRPSVRNMTSFMLQHQNLVANKHSIFYRFDEKEKREQTIDQVKIFAGFVTQEYFITKQKIAEEERTLKALETQQKAINDNHQLNSQLLSDLLKEYYAVTGNELFDKKAEILLQHPAKTLQEVVEKKIVSDYESDEHIKQLQVLSSNKNKLYTEKRTLLIKLNDVTASIQYAQNYKEHLDSLDEIGDAKIHLSECPFCNTSNEKIADEANALGKAIEWLNMELSKTPYMLDSLEAEQKEIDSQLKSISLEILDVHEEINKIHEITKQLSNDRSLEEQGLKIKLKVENLLETLLEEKTSNIGQQIIDASKEVSRLKGIIKEKFDVDNKIRQAEIYINAVMKKIGSNFEFEDSYRPINLKFSLETFELWHEKNSGEKIYLRSMGSGANWLYSHLTLFLALHKYFCSLGEKSLLPPILFLDQPSQVYFPTAIKDDSDDFDAAILKEKEGNKESVDEDLKAVTNLFNQMVKFCKETLSETGIEPQIIISDHADHLHLADDVSFDDLVANRRWRTRGFILPVEHKD